MRENDLLLDDGRTLHCYDRGPLGPGELAVFWLHGTPNLGAPPAPLFSDADRLGIRWLGYDRPGYGSSTPHPGRDLAAAARDIARIADHLGIERFALMGHSGGGPHALAAAALLPERVAAAVSIAGLAPFDAMGSGWFTGMHAAGEAGLRAALAGRATKMDYEAAAPEFDPTLFTDADWAALSGPWAWFDSVVGPAMEQGPDGLVDDDIAYVRPWGVECARLARPLLLLHGGQDRIVPAAHGEWLARHCPGAELWRYQGAGHLSVLAGAPAALDWLRTAAEAHP